MIFTVFGHPQPKGSARAFVPKGWTRAVVTTATKGLKAWEQQIATVAQTKASGTLLVGPVSIGIAFYLPRPKSLKNAPSHVKRPDLDKLVRGAIDALTGIIWKDDSQVVSIQAWKGYVRHESDAPRAEFEISGDGAW